MKRRIGLVCLTLFAAMACGSFLPALGQEKPWSVRAANAAMERWPDGRFAPAGARWAWNYELGTLLRGMDAVWFNTADGRYYTYIKNSVDQLVDADGSIPTYNAETNELDSILLGRQLLLLYGVTRDARYAKAATLLYQQLTHQPRTASGGFWHKQRYPNQMWLDGLYMAEPFYAEYAATFHHPEAFSDITRQFVLLDEHARDANTGLLYHGWDESKQEHWADKKTGDSSQFWARGMGWHMMALVDTISFYPEQDAGRKELIAELNRDAAAVAKVQDSDSGLWYQVMDKGGAKGNYLESSASCMIVYALARGVRQGYLPQSYLANAERGYKGILSHFIQTGPGDSVSLTGTVKVGGLGGEPYRDGSYTYYLNEKVVTDDPKGVGPFLLASVENENAQNAKLGRGDTVLVDAWFNSQKRLDAFGQQDYFHYKWNDQSNDGYSLLGHIFRNFGAQTKTLYTEPTASALHQSQVYIIASPDTLAKNPNPHYVNSEDGAQIAEWVKAGGVLVLLANDPANTDLEHFNLIADRFGIHFNSVLRKHVVGDAHESGKLAVPGGGPIFLDPHTLFMKDTCNISVQAPAVTAFQDSEGILMATAKYGKGTVFATVDPWLYNEYTDGRKLPEPYDNFAGGRELVRWIVAQIPPKAETLHVAADGTGEFNSIQSALDAAPDGGAQVMVAPGTYREVLTIDKNNIQLRGANKDASKTVVVMDKSAGANGGTLHSATVNVTADNFLAENITFQNDFNATHEQVPVGSQALALLVTGDRAVFHNVRLLGNQDTVYAGNRPCAVDKQDCISFRQYFSDCFIAGNVDFIFGDSKAVFDRCEIHSTAHAGGFITAQSKHYPEQDSGYVLNQCKLIADAGVTSTVFLGRPWRPYATVVYLNTEMGAQIDPAGWREWHPGETHSLDTAYYAEFNSTGPGAHHDQRDPHTHFLTPEQAKQFEPSVFLRGNDNWNPTSLARPE